MEHSIYFLLEFISEIYTPEQLKQVADALDLFIKDEGVADLLFEQTLELKLLEPSLLFVRFLRFNTFQDFDFDRAITILSQAIHNSLEDHAQKKDSPLFNRLMLAYQRRQVAGIDRINQDLSQTRTAAQSEPYTPPPLPSLARFPILAAVHPPSSPDSLTPRRQAVCWVRTLSGGSGTGHWWPPPTGRLYAPPAASPAPPSIMPKTPMTYFFPLPEYLPGLSSHIQPGITIFRRLSLWNIRAWKFSSRAIV